MGALNGAGIQILLHDGYLRLHLLGSSPDSLVHKTWTLSITQVLVELKLGEGKLRVAVAQGLARRMHHAEADVTVGAMERDVAAGIGAHGRVAEVVEMGDIVPVRTVVRGRDHDVLPTVGHTVGGIVATIVHEAAVGDVATELHLNVMGLIGHIAGGGLAVGVGVIVNEIGQPVARQDSVAGELRRGGDESRTSRVVEIRAVHLIPRLADGCTGIVLVRGGEIDVGPDGVVVRHDVSVGVRAAVPLGILARHILRDEDIVDAPGRIGIAVAIVLLRPGLYPCILHHDAEVETQEIVAPLACSSILAADVLIVFHIEVARQEMWQAGSVLVLQRFHGGFHDAQLCVLHLWGVIAQMRICVEETGARLLILEQGPRGDAEVCGAVHLGMHLRGLREPVGIVGNAIEAVGAIKNRGVLAALPAIVASRSHHSIARHSTQHVAQRGTHGFLHADEIWLYGGHITVDGQRTLCPCVVAIALLGFDIPHRDIV